MKTIVTHIIFLLSSFSIFAQQATIEGHIYHATNNEALAYATVQVLEQDKGTVTDSAGYFKILIQPGLYNLSATFTGFEQVIQHEILATTAKPIKVDFYLNEQVWNLETAEVRTDAFRHTAESPVSIHTFNVNEVERMPGATLDVSKYVKTLPGVSPRTSFGYNMIVRGGASLENRFYLDGIEIPAITHFNVQGTSGGPNGLLNTRLLKGAELHSGAFPAHTPNALSSVLEVESRDGRTDRFGGNFTLGATDWGFVLEGPMGKKSSYMFSARESFSQHLLKAIGLPVIPFYADAQYKQKIRFNPKNELTLMGLGTYDKYTLNLDAEATESLLYNTGYIPEGKQGLYTVGANYKHFLDNNSVYQFVLSRNFFYNQAAKFRNNTYDPSDHSLDYVSKEIENKLRLEHRFYQPTGEVSYGISLEHNQLLTDNYSLFTFPTGVLDTFDYNNQLDLLRYGGFFSWSNTYQDGALDVYAGLRIDGNTYNAKMQNPLGQLSPRLAVSYALAPDWRLSGSTGIYYQLPPYNLMTFENNGVLANQTNLHYMRSIQGVIGIEHIAKKGYQMRVEGFYKHYSQYPFLLNENISLGNANASYILVGNQPASSDSRGRSYGIELKINRKLNNTWFWSVNYAYIISQFENTKGELVSSAWDNRHAGNIVIGKTFRKNWQIGLRWAYAGGSPYTPYDMDLSAQKDIWNTNFRGLFDYTQLNEARLPAFHQLDFRVDKRFNFKKWTMSLFLDIQNAYKSPIALLPYLTTERDETNAPISNPDDASRYLVKIIASDTGRLLPTLGIMVDL